VLDQQPNKNLHHRMGLWLPRLQPPPRYTGREGCCSINKLAGSAFPSQGIASITEHSPKLITSQRPPPLSSSS
jgi:hypothetical protein